MRFAMSLEVLRLYPHFLAVSSRRHRMECSMPLQPLSGLRSFEKPAAPPFIIGILESKIHMTYMFYTMASMHEQRHRIPVTTPHPQSPFLVMKSSESRRYLGREDLYPLQTVTAVRPCVDRGAYGIDGHDYDLVLRSGCRFRPIRCRGADWGSASETR